MKLNKKEKYFKLEVCLNIIPFYGDCQVIFIYVAH